jgi:uncharacterized protein Yka (UPF0111/DUF47 family)
MKLLPRRVDTQTLDLVEEAGRNVQRATLLLRDLLAAWPEREELTHDLLLCEQEGDRITHDIIHRLNGGGNGGRRPFGADDGHALATALDDVVDYAEQTADTLSIYGIEAPMEQATAMGDVLVGAGEQIATALRGLRTGGAIAPHLVEIHRLENEGGIDPMVVIRWKDVFESLEASVDACEKVAHVLEGITLKAR